jgi:hypothetical protein
MQHNIMIILSYVRHLILRKAGRTKLGEEIRVRGKFCNRQRKSIAGFKRDRKWGMYLGPTRSRERDDRMAARKNEEMR